jgi:hypothetical protein
LDDTFGDQESVTLAKAQMTPNNSRGAARRLEEARFRQRRLRGEQMRGSVQRRTPGSEIPGEVRLIGR